jgi:hypothetical protein
MSTPPDPKVLAELSRAMMEHLIPRSVAIILHNEEDTLGGLGSGTPIQIGGRYFAATAAHVLDDVEITQVGVVALGGRVGKWSNATPKLVGWGRRGGKPTDAVDIGWLEIKPQAIEHMTTEWGRQFVTLDRVSLDPVPPEAAMYVFGAPGELTSEREIQGRPYVGLQALPYLTRALRLQGSGVAEHDLYVEYLSEMQSEEGTKPMPSAEGLSGSGLWRVNPNPGGIWSPDRAQLVAVQRTCSPGKYLRGTLMRDWLGMLREDLPELAPEIDPVLSK